MKIAIWWEQELWGGVDTHILTLLKNWNKNDELVLFSNSNNIGMKRIYGDLLEISNLSIITFNSSLLQNNKYKFINKLTSLLRPFLFFQSVFKYKKILKNYGSFDTLLSENGGYPASWGSLAALMSARNCAINKRVLLVHHEANKPRFFQKYFENYIDRKVNRVSTDIVAVSKATKDSLYKKRFFKKTSTTIKVVFNGLELKKKSIPVVNLREEYKISKRQILIGIVGRVEKYKGHEDLIYAYSLLSKEEQKKIQLIFIGNGHNLEIKRLKKIQNALNLKIPIVFTGYIEGEAKSIIEQMDMLCMVTKDFEGFGLTIGEAMLSDVPVLVTRVGAIPEFVFDEIASIVEPESPEQICSVIEAFVNDSSLFKIKATKARSYIKQFSPEKMVKELSYIFNN